eukprot:2829298-Karenia_brevis.AAC.1
MSQHAAIAHPFASGDDCVEAHHVKQGSNWRTSYGAMAQHAAMVLINECQMQWIVVAIVKRSARIVKCNGL